MASGAVGLRVWRVLVQEAALAPQRLAHRMHIRQRRVGACLRRLKPPASADRVRVHLLEPCALRRVRFERRAAAHHDALPLAPAHLRVRPVEACEPRVRVLRMPKLELILDGPERLLENLRRHAALRESDRTAVRARWCVCTGGRVLTSVTVENDSSSHTRNAAKSWDVCSLSKPPASKLASAPVALSRYANVGASTGCLSASSSFHTLIAPERIGSDSAWKSLYLRLPIRSAPPTAAGDAAGLRRPCKARDIGGACGGEERMRRDRSGLNPGGPRCTRSAAPTQHCPRAPAQKRPWVRLAPCGSKRASRVVGCDGLGLGSSGKGQGRAGRACGRRAPG